MAKYFLQCTKILSYTSPLQFYPSKFVLVTDLLDLFGELVFKRLKSKSEMIEYDSYRINMFNVLLILKIN